MIHNVNDAEMFQYNEKLEGDNIPMVEAIYYDSKDMSKVLFDGEMYAVIE